MCVARKTCRVQVYRSLIRYWKGIGRQQEVIESCTCTPVQVAGLRYHIWRWQAHRWRAHGIAKSVQDLAVHPWQTLKNLIGSTQLSTFSVPYSDLADTYCGSSSIFVSVLGLFAVGLTKRRVIALVAPSLTYRLLSYIFLYYLSFE